MGEGTSAAWQRAPKHAKAGSDKRTRNRLVELLLEAERALFDVATNYNARAPLLLLTKYYFRSEQIVDCKLTITGLIVDGLSQPIRIADEDRAELSSWLSTAHRVHSAQAVRNLIATLRKKVVARLEESQEAGATSSDWAGLLDVGVVALRRMSAERHAEACEFKEEVYRELLHDETANPYDVLRHLSRPARQILASAALAVLEEIREARERLEERR